MRTFLYCNNTLISVSQCRIYLIFGHHHTVRLLSVLNASTTTTRTKTIITSTATTTAATTTTTITTTINIIRFVLDVRS